MSGGEEPDYDDVKPTRGQNIACLAMYMAAFVVALLLGSREGWSDLWQIVFATVSGLVVMGGMTMLFMALNIDQWVEKRRSTRR